MAIFSKKKAKRRARQEAARQGLLSYMATEGVEAQKGRQMAAEQGRGQVFGMLGAPGTYDLPGAAASTPDYTNIFDTSGTGFSKKSGEAAGLLQYTKYLPKQARESLGHVAGQGLSEASAREGIIDPKKFASEVGKSAQFRIQSRQTAEAEQLLAEEGPMWDRLKQSTIGQIFEGASTQWRETMRDLKNQAAKGGSARRTALNNAREIMAKQDIAEMRINQTWQANLKLHEYVRTNADRVQRSNQSFLDNLPQIRDQYQQNMASLADSLVAATSAASAMSQAGYKARAAVGDSQFWEKLILGVASSAIGYATGGGASTAWLDNYLDDPATHAGYGSPTATQGNEGFWGKAGNFLGGLLSPEQSGAATNPLANTGTYDDIATGKLASGGAI